MRRVLVTGGAGFIGSNLIEDLLKQHKVRCVDNLSTGFRENIEGFIGNKDFEFVEADIRDFDKCIELTKDIDVVFHQAALGSVPRSIDDPMSTHLNNASGFLNMLNSSRLNGVDRFIYASSSSVYGDNRDEVKTERYVGEPLSPYAVSKKINELYANVFNRVYGMTTIGLRYFNVFGKNQSPTGAYAAVIPKFIDKIISNENIEIHGDGTQTRDFTHVSNVVHANLKVGFEECKSISEQRIYNVGCSRSYSVNDLVDTIKHLTQEISGKEYQGKVRHVQYRKGDVKHSLADISSISHDFNYSAVKDFEEGVRCTIEHFLEK